MMMKATMMINNYDDGNDYDDGSDAANSDDDDDVWTKMTRF